MKKETVFGLLIWAVIIGALVLGFKSCNWIEHRQAVRAEQAKREVEDEFNQWCAANNAAPAFRDSPASDLLTIDLQRSLFVNEKRAAFKAQLFNLYWSAKRGTTIARFSIDHGGAEVGVYLKCTESQAQQLRDAFHKNRESTFWVAAQFEDIQRDIADSDAEDHTYTYEALGTLLSAIAARGEQNE
jgi:hypothetical protein